MGLAIISSIFVGIVIYVISFKEDFKKEEIDKVTPFIIIVGIIIAIFQILSYL